MLPPFQRHAAVIKATIRDVGESGVVQSSRRAQLVSDAVEAAKNRSIWLSVLAVVVIAATALTLGLANDKVDLQDRLST